MDVFAVTILISLAIYVVVGNYAGRRIKHVDDYYVAGRRAPTLLIVGSLIASYLSTNAFLGETGEVYAGMAGLFILFPAVSALGYIYGSLYFGRYLRRSRARTVAQYLGERFQSARVQKAAGVTIIFGLGGYLLAVTQGAALIFSEITSLSYTQCLVLSWLSYTSFTLYAGSRGVIITDTIMFCLFSGVSMAALVYVVHSLGGWDSVMSSLATLKHDTGMLHWHGEVGTGADWPSALEVGIWAAVVWGAWGVVAAVSPWQSSRYLIARNEQVVIRAGVFCAILLPILNETTYFPVVSIHLVNPDIDPPAEAMIWLALNMVPSLLGAVLLTGIMAAALSSASTFLSLVGFAISNDVLPDKRRDDAQMIKLTRWVMLGVGLVVLAVGFLVPMDIFWLTYYVGTLFASSWGPVAFMSVWSKTITADAAFWGIISGFVGNILARTLDLSGVIDLPMLLHPIIIGALISFAVIIFLSRLGKVGEGEAEYRERLHRVPEEEQTSHWNLKWLPLMLLVYSVGISAFLLWWWIYPYHASTGQLTASGGIDWLSGDVLVNFAGVPLYVLMAWLVRRALKKDYMPAN